MQNYHHHKHQRVIAMLSEFRKWRWSTDDAVEQVAALMHISQDYVWRLSYKQVDLTVDQWPHSDLDKLYVEGIVNKYNKAVKEQEKAAPKKQPKVIQIQQPKLFNDNEDS